jgi:hypothetical protein
MSKTRYFCAFLVLIMLSSCATKIQSSTPPTIRLIDLLISSQDMPVGWKSFEVFSDEYDDLCYIDCAIIQFSPVEEDKVYSEQSVYAYNTSEEAERNYKNLLIPLQLGTTPSDWSYHSDTASQSNLACYTHKNKAFPSCSWIAQYGQYLVFFVSPLLPDRLSLSDLENIIYHIDSKMKVVGTKD